jgi:hypothetical protein
MLKEKLTQIQKYKAPVITTVSTLERLDVFLMTPAWLCPETCYNVYDLLPPEIRTNIVEVSMWDLPGMSPRNNVLFVARKEVVEKVAGTVQEWKQKGFKNFGLFLQADELNEDANSMHFVHFDYGIRNYYFDALTGAENLRLQTLGNISCGTLDRGFSFPESTDSPGRLESRFGVYWTLPLSNAVLPPLSLGSLIKTSERKHHCCFMGSLRQDRKYMADVFRNALRKRAGLKCLISTEKDFLGSLGPWAYGINGMAQCQIALLPIGNSPETIRMLDAVKLGAIPLYVDSPDHKIHHYMDKLIDSPPFLRADSWLDAVNVVIDAVGHPQELDLLQQSILEWYHRYDVCQRNDMRLLLEASYR